MNASTKPKGATTYRETAFGILPRSKLLFLELEGTKKGLEYIHGLVETKKAVRITPEYIRDLHGISFGWIFPGWAGKYRTVQVTFSGKEAVPYFEVPERITNLCRDLEERMKYLPHPSDEVYIIGVVRLLAWFQHSFVFIHPFRDYNGRIARMLTTLILLSLHLPAIEIKVETAAHRKLYLHAMQQADDGEYTLLEELLGAALAESLQK